MEQTNAGPEPRAARGILRGGALYRFTRQLMSRKCGPTSKCNLLTLINSQTHMGKIPFKSRHFNRLITGGRRPFGATDQQHHNVR